MDVSLQSILDSLPPKPSRSKLEPYKEFIHELRRRSRSYQEISEILRERCGVTAAVHTVYNFVRVREKGERKRRVSRSTGKTAEIGSPPKLAERPHVQPHSPPADDAWRNIEALKQRRAECPAEEKVFAYDEDEPLRLLRGTGHSLAGRKNKKPER